MKRDELVSSLTVIGVPPGSLSVGSIQNGECLCVVPDGGQWKVYYVERDLPEELASLPTEEDAYEFVYATFCKWKGKWDKKRWSRKRIKNIPPVFLEYAYSGDDAWNRFVDVYRERIKLRNDYDENEPAKIAPLLNCDIDMAIVAFGIIGGYNYIVKWLETPIPMLGGLKPSECLVSNELIRRLREFFMEYPV